MARPSEYTPTILEMAQHYRDNWHADENQVVPTVEGLALALGISRETVYAWAKDHGEFSDIVSDIRANKSLTLQNGGLSNKLNASVAKLLLGHEGYREAQDITSDGKALPQPILASVKEDE